MLLDLFLKAVDRGISLIKERETRRANFFKEIVEPIHKVFHQFRDQHFATFDEIREMLRDSSIPLEKLHDHVRTKEISEGYSWMLFEKLDELQSSSSAALGERYAEYIEQLQKCLLKTQGKKPEFREIRFYNSLHSHLNHCLFLLLKCNKGSESNIRKNSIKEVDKTTRQFQKYCTKVEMAYLRLRVHCLV